MSETPIMQRIRLALSRMGSRMFRNQVGTYQLIDGRWLSSGLCTGSSDLIGWTPTMITADMVGRTVAVFTAVEVKAFRGRARKEQNHFMDAVVNAGGIAGLARSEADAVDIIRQRWLKA